VTYLLDTNICIGWLNGGQPSLLQRLYQEDPSNLTLCSIVRAELLYGARKSVRWEANMKRLDQLFSRLASLPFDDAAADHYGQIRNDLEREGIPIGGNDLMIAAIARSRGLILVTHNTREFYRVADLHVEDWISP
jgi:tRNA(fMet)-specific endonuclease VapC